VLKFFWVKAQIQEAVNRKKHNLQQKLKAMKRLRLAKKFK
jgi:hypothetical protein